METSTKNQNQQQKAKTNNQRHLPVLVFEIELILSRKQERATKSNKKQPGDSREITKYHSDQ